MKRLIAQLLCICMVFAIVAAIIPQDVKAVSYSGSSSYASGPYYTALTALKLTGDQRRDIVSVAKTQIGYQEGDKSSQLSGTVQGEYNYTEYGRWYTAHKGTSYNHISSQWCAMFVSWCAFNAGISSNIVDCQQYTETQVQLFKNQGRAHRWSEVISGAYTPKAGDIIYFLSSSGAASGRTVNHVGLVSGWDGTTLYTIEGNTSSAYFTTNGGCCSDKTYNIGSSNLAYVCDPAYEDNSDPLPDEFRTAVFDPEYYVDLYSDVESVIGTDPDDLYNHFKDYGMKEGRRASAIFDVQHYVTANTDLASVFGNNYEAAFNHFIEYGYREPRYTAKSVDLGEKFFAKINYPSAGLTLDVTDGNVVTANKKSGTDQLWYFEKAGDGSYQITHYRTGDALAVENGSFSKASNVKVADKVGTNAQLWFIFENINGTYSLRAKCAPVCVLDIVGASTTAGANVQSYTYNSTPAQQFDIVKDTSVSVNTEFIPADPEIEASQTSDGEKIISGFAAGTSGNNAADMLDGTYKVFDHNGGTVTSGKLCTGYTIKKYLGAVEVSSAIVVVTGDATCDGVVNGKDLIRMKKQILTGGAVDYEEFADANRDGLIDSSDLEYLTDIIG